MDSEARVPQSQVSSAPTGRGDDTGSEQSVDHELIDWWTQVMQGFQATHDSVVNDLAQRFNLGRGLAGVLLRLLGSPQHRMPMSRLALEAGMSSGGFTKLADRLCAADLARRVSCENDRRVTYLELTEEGEDTAHAVSEAVTQALRTRVLDTLGRDGFSKLADVMRDLREANNRQ